MAIRNLWNRPLLLKYKNITDSSSGIVNKSEYNSVESLRINIEIAKYKGIISLIVAIVLTVLMTLKSTPQITAETRDLSISFSYSAYLSLLYLQFGICLLELEKERLLLL